MIERAGRREILHRIGRRKRALVLLLFGFIFAVNGWVQYDQADQVSKSPMARQSYAAHIDVMPLKVWAVVFIVVGATSAVAGFVRQLPAWLGFAGIQALSTFWGLLFAASYFQTHYGRAWIGLLNYATIAGVLAIIADWEDPPAHPTAVSRWLNEVGGEP